MTYKDIIIQMLSEATGKPKNEFENVINMFKNVYPTGHKLDDQLTQEQAENLLTKLRKNRESILAWYVKCSVDFNKNT